MKIYKKSILAAVCFEIKQKIDKRKNNGSSDVL